MLRTLCLELDLTTLLLQSLAFRVDPAATPHALALEGRADVKWLVHRVGKAAASRDAARERWLQSLADGFTPPFVDTLVSFADKLEMPARLRRLLGPLRRETAEGRRKGRVEPQLSEIRVQSAVWAAKSE